MTGDLQNYFSIGFDAVVILAFSAIFGSLVKSLFDRISKTEDKLEKLHDEIRDLKAK